MVTELDTDNKLLLCERTDNKDMQRNSIVNGCLKYFLSELWLLVGRVKAGRLLISYLFMRLIFPEVHQVETMIQ